MRNIKQSNPLKNLSKQQKNNETREKISNHKTKHSISFENNEKTRHTQTLHNFQKLKRVQVQSKNFNDNSKRLKSTDKNFKQ